MNKWDDAPFSPEGFLEKMNEADRDESLYGLIPPYAKSVIDLACGPAGLLRDRKPFFEYTGVDSCDKYMEWCRKKYPEQTFIVEDINSFTFKKRYDVCCVKSALYYVVDVPAFLEKVLNNCDMLILVTERFIYGGEDEVRINVVCGCEFEHRVFGIDKFLEDIKKYDVTQNGKVLIMRKK